jgi:hypothetical protein
MRSSDQRRASSLSIATKQGQRLQPQTPFVGSITGNPIDLQFDWPTNRVEAIGMYPRQMQRGNFRLEPQI